MKMAHRRIIPVVMGYHHLHPVVVNRCVHYMFAIYDETILTILLLKGGSV